ncbi:RNA 2',3'-cyclic phosphodiesterase [Candidatus Gracilibacteria bacterium]|nr:RNA 2',3'-cyclic phosphodiesterase [Candidatus Gracilibacteria bacterium]
MRLFIALDLPSAISAELLATQERLQALGARPVSWTRSHGLHLTLQFLGEQQETLVAPLLAALAMLPPLACTLGLAGLGAFPNATRPQVLWAGLAGDVSALHELRWRVVAATAALGIVAETRPYRPHLTLGRVRGVVGKQQYVDISMAMAHAAPPAPLEWLSGSPLLYQSLLTAQGVRYRVLGSAEPPEDCKGKLPTIIRSVRRCVRRHTSTRPSRTSGPSRWRRHSLRHLLLPGC